jgi:anti-sigma regulatory factor (Ser/Thr protein kinase)
VVTTQTRSFRARRAECADAAAFVESVVQGMDERLAMKARLAIEELFLNTVTHGHGGDTDAPVHVTVQVDDGRVALTYVDTAPPFNPFAEVEEPDEAAVVDERPIGRVGVFLITRLAERCDYCRDGDRNRVTVALRA